MRRARTRKSFALFGLAVLVFAALVPSVATGLHDIVLVPLWVVTEAPSVLLVRRSETRDEENQQGAGGRAAEREVRWRDNEHDDTD